MIFKSFVKLPECANFDKHIQFSTINCDKLNELLAVHPFAPVTVTVYIPAHRPETDCEFAPFDQR